MIKDYRTTLGGAFGALGTALMGIGVVPQLSGTPSKFLTVVAGVGFACNALGIFFGHLFSADSQQITDTKKEVAAAIDSKSTESLKRDV